jgi:ABC-2 type transport system permease protein
LFIAIGIISASALIVFKRGDPVNWLVIQLSHVFGGILFPIALLPRWAQELAWLFPIRYALEAVRRAMLTGSTIRGMAHELIPLIAFTVALLPVSVYACGAFVNSSKTTGNISVL